MKGEAPNGDSIAERSMQENAQLPAVYHQPHWMGLSNPPSWICTACSSGWDNDGVMVPWPCVEATRHGLEIARELRLEYSW